MDKEYSKGRAQDILSSLNTMGFPYGRVDSYGKNGKRVFSLPPGGPRYGYVVEVQGLAGRILGGHTDEPVIAETLPDGRLKLSGSKNAISSVERRANNF